MEPIIEIGMIVETNQEAVGRPKYDTLLRLYSEDVSKDEPGAWYAAGLRGNVQRIACRDEGKPYMVEVTFLDGSEDTLFVSWLNVVSSHRLVRGS